jgi:hypothetical protein
MLKVQTMLGSYGLCEYSSFFQKQISEYYNIENLWGDAKITTIENKY